jgi:phosphotransferase system  glucose/maltose/N-acetylglucosamine-specific IIC component
MEFLFGCYVAGIIFVAVVVFWVTEQEPSADKFSSITRDVAYMAMILMWPLYFILSLLAFPPYLIRKAIRYIKNHHSRNQNNE